MQTYVGQFAFGFHFPIPQKFTPIPFEFSISVIGRVQDFHDAILNVTVRPWFPFLIPNLAQTHHPPPSFCSRTRYAAGCAGRVLIHSFTIICLFLYPCTRAANKNFNIQQKTKLLDLSWNLKPYFCFLCANLYVYWGEREVFETCTANLINLGPGSESRKVICWRCQLHNTRTTTMEEKKSRCWQPISRSQAARLTIIDYCIRGK